MKEKANIKPKEEESIKQKHVVQAWEVEDTRKQDEEVPKEAYQKEQMNIGEKLVSDEKDLYNTYIDEVDEKIHLRLTINDQKPMIKSCSGHKPLQSKLTFCK